MMIGSCFHQNSFTCSGEQASALLSTGVSFRGTLGTSQCFCQHIPGINVYASIADLMRRSAISMRSSGAVIEIRT